MQKHWDVMRSDNAGDLWTKVSGNLATDFGFVIDVHAHEPETVFIVPIKATPSTIRSTESSGVPQQNRRQRLGAADEGVPQKDCYVNVLREAMDVDSLDKCGVYFGTTGGQVYCSADAGDSWKAIVHDLPPVVSVEVQTV